LRAVCASAAGGRPSTQAWGLVLFRRQGFAGWFKALCALRTEAPPPVAGCIAVAATEPGVAATVHAPLVAVLSQMVLARYQEVVA